MGEDYSSFDFGGGDDFDISSFLSGDSSGLSGIDLSGLGTDVQDLDFSNLVGTDFEELDLSNIFNNADGQGIDFSGFDNLDISNLLGTDLGGDLSRSLGSKRVNLDEYERNLLGPGDFDQAAPPANIAELLQNVTGGDDSLGDLLTPGGVNESFLDNLSPEERARYNATQEEGYVSPLANLPAQDLGISQEMMDEFNQNFNPAGGFGSQYQTVGTNRVMVNDDGTATILNPTTGESSYLDEAQTQALINNGTLNTKGSGYVDATGGKGYVPGGGKTITNADGTKTVITGDGKVLKVDKDGTVTDTGKKVDVNDKKIETDTKKIIKDAVTTKTPTGKKDNNNMLMALLALMAMMNKGGGGSKGAGSTIPSLQANRTQLPYGAISGSQARPGAGGVNYFSPTTYTQKAAGGGMMYGGGGISDLGGYSDGGRLLKGPGDGVSDSIPATIGGKQPARLAEGEFVVPARIVSELGNGSTEAGAKKLYAMMDRVQKARRKTKNVAADTKAHKYLPA
jgi:hypothetical protein